MKHPFLFPAFSLAVAFLSGVQPSVHANPFQKAEISRVYNDVQVLKKNVDPVPAKIGDSVQGETQVATGPESRAELRFPDKSLTRMGANSVFRLQTGSRTMELERGVILLQVPKKMNGAKVRTAAVTAAVTGTTLMLEYVPGGYIKLIVVEGEVDLFFNGNPANFITLNQGEMLIMRTDAEVFPNPVKVDLERLIATSRLMDPEVFGELGNLKQLEQALNEQEKLKDKGELIQTAFIIEGRGTRVSLSEELRLQLARSVPGPEAPPPGGGSPGGGSPAAVQELPFEEEAPGPGGPELPPPTTYLDNAASISTNPTTNAFNDPGGFTDIPGTIYNPLDNGPVKGFLFGAPAGPPETQEFLEGQGPWSAFTFYDLVVAGNPDIDSSGGIRNLILASETGVIFSDVEVLPELSTGNELVLDDSLDSLAILAASGSIVVEPGFSINGAGEEGGQRFLLDAFGPEGDVQIFGNADLLEDESGSSIEFPDGVVQVNAGRDVLLDAASINSGDVGILAGRDVTIKDASVRADQSLQAVSGRNLQIDGSDLTIPSYDLNTDIDQVSLEVSSSSELLALSEAEPGQLLLYAQNGSVNVTESYIEAMELLIESQTGNITLQSNTVLQADVIKARTLSANGILTIGGNSEFNATDLIRLYAEGANGRIHFTGPATLDASRIDLAASNVRINAGVDVNVPQNTQFRVYTDSAEFSNNTANGFGRFTNEGESFSVQGGTFSNRPDF